MYDLSTDYIDYISKYHDHITYHIIIYNYVIYLYDLIRKNRMLNHQVKPQVQPGRGGHQTDPGHLETANFRQIVICLEPPIVPIKSHSHSV